MCYFYEQIEALRMQHKALKNFEIIKTMVMSRNPAPFVMYHYPIMQRRGKDDRRKESLQSTGSYLEYKCNLQEVAL